MAEDSQEGLESAQVPVAQPKRTMLPEAGADVMLKPDHPSISIDDPEHPDFAKHNQSEIRRSQRMTPGQAIKEGQKMMDEEKKDDAIVAVKDALEAVAKDVPGSNVDLVASETIAKDVLGK